MFDESRPTTAAVAGPSLNQARAHHNTVLLPDGSMVSVGGGYGNRSGDLRLAGPEHLTSEIWSPATNTWRRGPAQVYKRAYHSTALLLPDGRVVSAGDDRDTTKPGKADRRLDVAEIYEPAYLFAAGPRPAITDAPAGIKWDGAFAVKTSSPITRAVLMAPGATTHANDMQQRHVELRITPNGTGATLVAPPNANVAPPGYYMLFGAQRHRQAVGREVGLPELHGVAGAGRPGADTTAPVFSLAIRSKKIGRVTKKGLKLRLTSNEGGRAKVKVTVSRATARKLKLKRPVIGRVKVGKLERSVASGRSKPKVKLKSAARKAIKQASKVNVRAKVTITDAAGNSTQRAKARKLKR